MSRRRIDGMIVKKTTIRKDLERKPRRASGLGGES